MKTVLLELIFCSVLYLSCKDSNGIDAIQTIDMTTAKDTDVKQIFDSLEVICFDDSPEAIIGDVVQIVSCKDYYIFRNVRNTIFVFDKDGRFLSSSRQVIGHGKGELGAVLGCTYNPHSRLIEVLTPTSIKFYDAHFNFKKSVSLSTKASEGENKPGLYFDYIYDISSHEHVLFSGGYLRSNGGALYIYNSEDEKIIQEITFSDEVIDLISNQKNCFAKNDDNTFAFLPYLTNKVFTFDAKSLTLTPFLNMDFGDKTVTKQLLSDMPKSTIDEQRKRLRFIKDGEFLFPVAHAICNNHLFSYIRNGEDLNDWYIIDYDIESKAVRKFKLTEVQLDKFFVHSCGDGHYLYVVGPDRIISSACINSFQEGDNHNRCICSRDSADYGNIVLLKYRVK